MSSRKGETAPSGDVKESPLKAILAKLRKRHVIETLAAFIGVGIMRKISSPAPVSIKVTRWIVFPLVHLLFFSVPHLDIPPHHALSSIYLELAEGCYGKIEEVGQLQNLPQRKSISDSSVIKIIS